MFPSGLAMATGALGLRLVLVAGVAKAVPPAPAAAALARLSYVERKVEQGPPGSWREAREGGALQVGDQLRTAQDALLRVDFSWMAMTVSASSVIRFPEGPFLQTILDQGRVALLAERREMLKLLTDEAEVRGRGSVIVRRRDKDTLVSSLAGRFYVEGTGRALDVPAGSGTIVRAGQPPTAAVALPAPPEELAPGGDPVFVAPGELLHLRWKGRAASYHVELLAVGSETVLLERDVTVPELELAIRWPGAFRWRVASRDAGGLEGLPSGFGLICVDQ